MHKIQRGNNHNKKLKWRFKEISWGLGGADKSWKWFCDWKGFSWIHWILLWKVTTKGKRIQWNENRNIGLAWSKIIKITLSKKGKKQRNDGDNKIEWKITHREVKTILKQELKAITAGRKVKGKDSITVRLILQKNTRK